MKNKLITAILSIFGLALILGPQVAWANGGVSLRLSPPSQRVVLDPSPEHNNLEYSLNLTNSGTADTKVDVYTGPYSANSDQDGEYVASFSKENNRTQLSRWISFKDVEGKFVQRVTVEIKQGESKDVIFKISVPENIPAGGQYAAIFAENVGDLQTNNSGVREIQRPSMVLYGVAKGETDLNAKITDYHVPTFILGNPVTFKAAVQNQGNTDVTISQKLTIKNIFNKTIIEQERALPVLPETERKVSLKTDKMPIFGLFWVNYAVQIPETNQIEAPARLVLVMPFFFLVILLVLLTIFIGWLILFVRQHKTRKARTLKQEK